MENKVILVLESGSYSTRVGYTGFKKQGMDAIRFMDEDLAAFLKKM